MGLGPNAVVETSKLDEESGKMVVQTTYDNTAVLEANAADRMSRGADYSGALVHVGRMHMGDIVRLKALGYNLLSPDPAETRRALLYVQSNEPYLLTVEGKPFAKTRPTWV